MTITALPSNWVEATFDDVLADISNGIAIPQNKEGEGVPVSRIETIASGKVDFSRVGFVSGVSEDEVERFLLSPGEILFSHINSPAHIGKTAIFRAGRLYHGTNLLRIKVDSAACLAEYFEYYCRYFRAVGGFSLNAQHAVNQSSLNQKKIKAFSIPLPPLAEQTRIAAKLDELLAQVDTLKARIDGIPALLKRFRQSVLAAAVSGRLTEEWRVQSVGLSDEASLPENQCEAIWPKVPLQSLIAGIEQGWSPKCESDSVAEAEEAWAVIKTTSIQPIEFYPSENKRLPESLSPRPELSVRAGDLLITRAGPRSRAAVCCYVKKTQPYLIVCDKAYRFRAQASVMDGRLLCLFLNSPQYISLLDDLKTGISESGMNLTMRKFQELQIPRPSLEEQAEIVRRVEQLFAFADQLEAKVNEAKARIDRLTQSILAKAFRGELVPQDPNDEPASELLARIQAQRAAAPKARRTRKA
ncbi:Type-1 restriction enzyme EcoKI specificity protein [compost metagenome]